MSLTRWQWLKLYCEARPNELLSLTFLIRSFAGKKNERDYKKEKEKQQILSLNEPVLRLNERQVQSEQKRDGRYLHEWLSFKECTGNTEPNETKENGTTLLPQEMVS